VTRGSGSDANPLDGCRIYVGIELRDGRVAWLDARVNQPIAQQPVPAVSSAIVRSGRISGCETARRAVAALSGLAVHRSADEAAQISATHLLRTLEAQAHVDPASERCILTAIGALRSALIDAHVTALAEATVERKKLTIR